MAERRLHVLNNSRAAAFRRCPRLHYYSYELGYVRLEKAEALQTGTRFHTSLEAWWKAKASGADALEAALAALEPVDDPYEQVRQEALIKGYHCRWGNEPIEVLAVEMQFEAPLRHPISVEEHPEFILSGTIDALCRTKEGRVLVVEHKTTSQDFSAGSYYWEKLLLNAQVNQYLAAGQAIGVQIDGCLYDVIGKGPDIQPKLATPIEQRKYTKEGRLYAKQRDTDEPIEEFEARLIKAITDTPEKFFGRGEVVRLGDELESALFDVWDIANLITEARKKARWPRNPDACFQFNRACDFWPVCAHGENLENEELFIKERQEG